MQCRRLNEFYTLYLSPLWNRSVAKSCRALSWLAACLLACFVLLFDVFGYILTHSNLHDVFHFYPFSPFTIHTNTFAHTYHHFICIHARAYMYNRTIIISHFCTHHIIHKYIFRSLFFSSAPLILWIYRGKCTWMLSQNYHVDISLIHIIYLGPRNTGNYPRKIWKLST